MTKLRYFIWRWVISRIPNLYLEMKKIDRHIPNLSEWNEQDLEQLYIEYVNHLIERNEFIHTKQAIPSYSGFRRVLSINYYAPKYRSRTKEFYRAKQCRRRNAGKTFIGYRKGIPLLSNKLVGNIG